MTRKNKKSNTPITWYGGRFSCRPIPQSNEKIDVFVWGTMNKIIARKLAPHDAPDSVLLDLYNETTATTPAPNIVHLIDDAHASLFTPTQKLSVKTGKRAAFIDLIDGEQSRIETERLQEHRQKNPLSYLKTGAPPEDIAGFLSAATALYRAKPWENFTCSGFEFALQAPAFELDDCLLEMESFVFRDDENPILMLEFDRGVRDLTLGFSLLEDEPSFAQEATANGWELPDEKVFPRLYAFYGGNNTEMNADDIRATRAVCEALLHFIQKHRHMTLLPDVPPTTESIPLSWAGENKEITITGPHPESDYQPYEPSSYDFDHTDEDPNDDDFEDDDTNVK
jgi:hypothetical protein